ncbi:MAG: hypothetical protein ACMUJM_25010 [bacterium]
MNDYYTVAEDVISACEGEMVKGIGDCILAVFKISEAPDFIKTAQYIKTSLERWWNEKIENLISDQSVIF